MTTHTIRRGFDVRLSGRPELALVDASEPQFVAVETAEFLGIKPKVLVKEGARVTTGQPLFLDKRDRTTTWCSPATGTVEKVELGARRFLLRVVIRVDAKEEFYACPRAPKDATRAQMAAALQGAGLWPLLVQRPIGRMPAIDIEPVAIFVNGMDTEPLASDPSFATRGQKDNLQAGVDALKRLTTGKVYVALRAGGEHNADLRSLSNVDVHEFSGPHPAGLVGTHIAHIRPLKQSEKAIAVRAQDVARIGEWARTGRYPARCVVAVGGSEAPARKYFRIRQGAPIAAVLGGQAPTGDVRILAGTVLNGTALAGDAWLPFRAATITVMQEGAGRRDLFGWALPQFGKLSASRSVFSWMFPNQEHEVDARLHGGHRPIVNIGSWESVTPLDLHPSYLIRAILANDIEEAVKLGLLEVTEEDLALCTFVDPCKTDVGAIIRQGLDMFEKEG